MQQEAQYQVEALTRTPFLTLFPSRLYVADAERLPTPVQLPPRYCEVCHSEQVFMANREFAEGRIAACVRCGDEIRVPFSRTTSEVCA